MPIPFSATRLPLQLQIPLYFRVESVVYHQVKCFESALPNQFLVCHKVLFSFALLGCDAIQMSFQLGAAVEFLHALGIWAFN